MKKILVIGLVTLLVLSMLSSVALGFEKKFAREGGGSCSGTCLIPPPPPPPDEEDQCPCGEIPIYFLKRKGESYPPGTHDQYCLCTENWELCTCRAKRCLPC